MYCATCWNHWMLQSDTLTGFILHSFPWFTITTLGIMLTNCWIELWSRRCVRLACFPFVISLFVLAQIEHISCQGGGRASMSLRCGRTSWLEWTKQLLVHHPLEDSFAAVVDEPQNSFMEFTLATYPFKDRCCR